MSKFMVDKVETCWRCHGTGMIRTNGRALVDGGLGPEIYCWDCAAKGTIHTPVDLMEALEALGYTAEKKK